jgi:hypothetical protein
MNQARLDRLPQLAIEAAAVEGDRSFVFGSRI